MAANIILVIFLSFLFIGGLLYGIMDDVKYTIANMNK